MVMEKEYFTITSRKLGFKLLLNYLSLVMEKIESQLFMSLIVQD